MNTTILPIPQVTDGVVSQYGPWQVQGPRLVPTNTSSSTNDASNLLSSLAGMSLFWSNTGWNGEHFYNRDLVEWLIDDWDIQILRIPLGVETPGGYLDDPVGNWHRLEIVLHAAIERDVYVIVDWHSHQAHEYTQSAVSFFQQFAQTYGSYDHVLYEIYNEPGPGVEWNRDIRPYAETILRAIRKYDPVHLVVVGTPHWSQRVDVAAQHPLHDQHQVAYALHFYAGTHGATLRHTAERALQTGLPLFVTEWGTVNADGTGNVNETETYEWIQWMQQHQISHLNWCINDKAEGASALRPGANPHGHWKLTDLTSSGSLVKRILYNHAHPKIQQPNVQEMEPEL